ncbi:DUF3102 domain-containing protein [Candidatus Pacearchaeota archaeon]|jgi:hypothetical protein|nr:DUF3102 domain-containing protein [Candidatus Pacearchaeota archaeon]
MDDYPQVSIDNASQEIKRLHEGIEAKMRTSVQDAIRIGEILSSVKEKKEHGDFLPWVKTLPFTERTAQRYIQVFQHRDKTDRVSDLQEAYKQVETLEAQEKLSEGKKARLRIIEFNKTGIRPDGWRRGTDDKLAQEEKERDKSTAELKERIRLETEKRSAKASERAHAFEDVNSLLSDLSTGIAKRQDFKERIRVSHEGKDDPFVDAIMDYLETLADDNRRIEACYNIIKVCKGIANDLQAKK